MMVITLSAANVLNVTLLRCSAALSMTTRGHLWA
jgi:hypothetical protein